MQHAESVVIAWPRSGTQPAVYIKIVFTWGAVDHLTDPFRFDALQSMHRGRGIVATDGQSIAWPHWPSMPHWRVVIGTANHYNQHNTISMKYSKQFHTAGAVGGSSRGQQQGATAAHSHLVAIRGIRLIETTGFGLNCWTTPLGMQETSENWLQSIRTLSRLNENRKSLPNTEHLCPTIHNHTKVKCFLSIVLEIGVSQRLETLYWHF